MAGFQQFPSVGLSYIHSKSREGVNLTGSEGNGVAAGVLGVLDMGSALAVGDRNLQVVEAAVSADDDKERGRMIGVSPETDCGRAIENDGAGATGNVVVNLGSSTFEIYILRL